MRAPFLTLIAAAAVLAGCDKPPAPPKSTALARVGAKEILPAELVAEAQRRAAVGQPIPDKAALLDEMVLAEAMVQRALALKLDQDPEVARAWRSLLIGTLKGRELDPNLPSGEIPAADVRAYYDANQAAFAQPEKARLGMIFAAVPPQAPAAQVAPIRARMDEAHSLAAATADGFKQAAVKFSDHQASRYRGGEIGWVMGGKPPAYLPPNVAAAAFALPVGALSDVIEAKDGLYLVTMLEHTPAGVRPLAQVESNIVTLLTKQRREARQREFDELVRQQAGVQTFPEVLRQTTVPLPPQSTPEPPAAPRTANH